MSGPVKKWHVLLTVGVLGGAAALAGLMLLISPAGYEGEGQGLTEEEQIKVAVYKDCFEPSRGIIISPDRVYYFLDESDAVIAAVVDGLWADRVRSDKMIQIVSKSRCRHIYGDMNSGYYEKSDGCRGAFYETKVLSRSRRWARVSVAESFAPLGGVGFEVELERSHADGRWHVKAKKLMWES